MKSSKPEIHILYSSAATRPFAPRDLIDLLTVSRRNNARLGISGMLLYIDETFFQILEGAAEDLGALYLKIVRDPRHTQIVKLIEEPIDNRAFSTWSMGYAEASRAELSAIPGLNDFFAGGSCFDALEPGRARILLQAFREGKWRRRLTA